MVRMHFDIEIDTDGVRVAIMHDLKVKPGHEEQVQALISDTSIACGLKASVGEIIPKIIDITTENLAYLVAEHCEEEAGPSNPNVN